MNNSNIKYIAFDTETEAISYSNPIPDLICLTYSEVGELKGQIKTPWEHDIESLVRGWWDKGYHTVGHNMAFDLSILAFKYPALLPDIFKALDNNQIHDTMLREKLLNITQHGSIDYLEVNGLTHRLTYSLSDLEKNYLNIDRSELKDDSNAPRTNYAVYKNIPLEKWDDIFISYAIDDAINTGMVYQSQNTEAATCIDMTGLDPFKVETFTVRKHFALRLIECVGTRLDKKKVQELADEFNKEYNSPRLVDPLVKAGIVQLAKPPQPYANGAKDHLPSCRGHKDHPEFNRKPKIKVCDCPPKMKKAVPEKTLQQPLQQIIWDYAGKGYEDIEAWPSEATLASLKDKGILNDFVEGKAFKKDVFEHTKIADIKAREQENIVRISKIIKGATSAVSDVKEAKKALKRSQDTLKLITAAESKGMEYFKPLDIKLTTGGEWAETFADRDPLLALWQEREKIKKIVNEYIPKMFIENEDGSKEPAAILRAAYGPLVLSGRTHSWASKLYPSRSDQTVDPRVRPCTIPREGNVFVSTDYNGMELGTLAQACIDLFGFSELGEKINKGIDTHAYLAAQIARELDSEFASICKVTGLNNSNDDVFKAFSMTKKCGDECSSEDFNKIFRKDYFKKKGKALDRPVLWKDFFKHYRTLAKPVGLGYPGMLGAKTLCSMAKATYGLDISEELAIKLKDIWIQTYPEMKLYLDYIMTRCIDQHHTSDVEEDEDGNIKKKVYYCFTTKMGLHRAKAGICEAANGVGLQAYSAEGATHALYNLQKAIWLAEEDSLLSDVCIVAFIHDEVLWECPNDKKIGARARAIEKIMIDSMQEFTPNVKAGAESAAMLRWYKQAEPVWADNNLIPWIPTTTEESRKDG